MDIAQLGSRLYDMVFAGAVGTSLVRNLERTSGRPRIVLRLDKKLANLSAVPWELLYSSHLNRYLAPSVDTPIVRYLEVTHSGRMEPVSPPLVVLGLLSDPRGMDPLYVEEEWDLVQDAVTSLGTQQIRLERVRANWSVLLARLRQGPVHVIHFIGHGLFDLGANQGGLVFEDEAGVPVLAWADQFKILLHDQPELRLVFLNACDGAKGTRSDSFAGVAQQLVQQGIPAVVTVQFPVGDRAALTLSREFYKALADGSPMGAAIGEARKAIFGMGDRLEWATPVFFSRAKEIWLIEVPQRDRYASLDIQAFEPETVLIHAGPFLMDSSDPSTPTAEQSQYQVDLPTFRMGKTPVTVRQYAAFISERKEHPAPPGWFNREPFSGNLDQPITNVNWRDALAYCIWLTEHTGRLYALPSEPEWEKACGHNCVEGMLGAVQQWTRSLWGRQPTKPEFAYPYDPEDGRECSNPMQLPFQTRVVHRGGSFRSRSGELRCTVRGNASPDSKVDWRGFRVAMSLEEKS